MFSSALPVDPERIIAELQASAAMLDESRRLVQGLGRSAKRRI
jgi:hypothetical protein